MSFRTRRAASMICCVRFNVKSQVTTAFFTPIEPPTVVPTWAMMAKAGADAIIAHVGTTVGGSIGVKKAVVTWDFTLKRTQQIIDAARRVRKDIFFLAHGGPI